MGEEKETRPKRPRKDLTLRERKLLREIGNGVEPNTALLRAGYSPSSNLTPARIINRRPEIRKSFREVLEAQGLSDEHLATKLLEGLDSTKVISATITNKGSAGMADAGGRTNDFIEVPDFATRHRYLDTALKLKGHLTDKVEVTHTISYEDRLRKIHEREAIDVDVVRRDEGGER